VACTLDILGDKWSMIVIRDLFLGVNRFNDFLRSPEHITTNILTARLQHLEEEGIISKTAYQKNPVRYEYFLTKKGSQLAPLMKAMIDWARVWQEEVIIRPFPEEPIARLNQKLS
jgi:DNA-binding HxlR family transcriptional regulator